MIETAENISFSLKVATMNALLVPQDNLEGKHLLLCIQPPLEITGLWGCGLT